MWHVNCCNAEINGGGGWGIFNAILGWENSATYGSVISYNLYWVAIMIGFASMRYFEKHGHWPLMKAKVKSVDDEEFEMRSSDYSGEVSEVSVQEKSGGHGAPASSTVREIPA